MKQKETVQPHISRQC